MSGTLDHYNKGKAKPIDKVLQEEQDNGGGCGYEDVIVWPAEPTTAPQTAIEEEDLLGYGTAEPTTSSSRNRQVPRRSSLSNSMHGSDPQRLSNRRASIGYTGEMTLVLPTKETVTKRRSIQFSDDDTVHSASTRGYGDDDNDSDANNNNSNEPPINTRQLWFRQEEYRHIEQNIRKIVRDAKYSMDRPTWQLPETRGLEAVMDSSIGEERQTAILSVLEDQQSQRDMGVFDEETIASTYQYNSMDAQLMAAERAKRDEQEIQSYMENTRRIHQKLQRRVSC